MQNVLGVFAIGFLVLISFAGLTGRLTMRSCCSPVPPELDPRLNPGADPSTAPVADR
jgi:hypothetical protein